MKQHLLQKIKTQLDSRAAVYASLLLAIVNKSLLSLTYTSLKGDKALYLLLSKGLLQTGKLVEPVPVFETGSIMYVYDPAAISPLYSLLAAPFLWLTGSYYWTQLILSIAGWMLFFPALYLMAKAIFTQRWKAVIFVLFSAFFLYPHELSSTPKDTFAVAFCIWSMVLMHRWLKGRPTWYFTIAMAVTFFCLALAKLLYVPLVAVLLFLLFLSVTLQKSKVHFFHFCLLGVLLLLGAFAMKQWLLHSSLSTTQTAFVRLPANTYDINIGFTPENLLETYPFISSSLVNTHLWAVQLSKLTGVSFTAVMKSFLFLDALLLTVLVAASLLYSRWLLSNNRPLFLVMASFVMMAIPIYLSVSGHVVKYKSGSHFWTYVMDSRSFLLPMICVQLFSFLAIFSLKKGKALRRILCVLFLLAAVHGAYFSLKESVSSRLGTNGKKDHDVLDHMANLLTKAGNGQAALVTSDNFLRRYLQVKQLPVFAFSSLPVDSSRMQKGQWFLVATYPEDSVYREKFPGKGLHMADTLPPFFLHRYESK